MVTHPTTRPACFPDQKMWELYIAAANQSNARRGTNERDWVPCHDCPVNWAMRLTPELCQPERAAELALAALAERRSRNVH